MSRVIQTGAVCFRCATMIPDKRIRICPTCGSTQIDERSAKPIWTPPEKGFSLGFPWNIQVKAGQTMLLSGNKGSGKTTLTLRLRPSRFITTEQSQRAVAESFWRINGTKEEDGSPIESPIITSCSEWPQLESAVRGMYKGEIAIVDSISQLATVGHEVRNIVSRIGRENRRSQGIIIMIAHHTKAGDFAGPNEAAHQVDVTADIPSDRVTGMRRLAITKNRNGPTPSTYFRLTADGPEPEDFQYGYSIEGPAGSYALHLYPMGGARYDGMMKILAENGVSLMGCASAAISCRAYHMGFAEPGDSHWRRKFAERHGLFWISPQRAAEILTSPEDYHHHGWPEEFKGQGDIL